MARIVGPRLPDWEARLNALIADRLHRPFAWGAHDCALWGADAVLAQTGEDFGAPFRGRYADARGAAEALRQFGGGTVVRTFDAHLDRVRPAFARRGDLARLRPDPASPSGAIGVVIGSDALFVTDHGLARAPRARWSICWRV